MPITMEDDLGLTMREIELFAIIKRLVEMKPANFDQYAEDLKTYNDAERTMASLTKEQQEVVELEVISQTKGNENA